MHAVPIDFTNKSPIDLLIELNRLKIAKNAGNNNTLARSSALLDRLHKLHKMKRNVNVLLHKNSHRLNCDG